VLLGGRAEEPRMLARQRIELYAALLAWLVLATA